MSMTDDDSRDERVFAVGGIRFVYSSGSAREPLPLDLPAACPLPVEDMEQAEHDALFSPRALRVHLGLPPDDPREALRGR